MRPMMRGIAAVKPGATTGDIGHAIQSFVEPQGMSVVRDFCGHGLGRLFHDEPNIIHIGRPGEGVTLKPGMFFTIEPMINLGKPHVKILSDGWTAVTRDRSLSAQFEHSVGVTATGFEIFTLSQRNASKSRLWRRNHERDGGCKNRPARHVEAPMTAKTGAIQKTRPPNRRIITAIGSGCANAFIAPEPDALSDYELLEMVLFAAQPRRDMKPLAKSLLEQIRLVRRSHPRAGGPLERRSTESAIPRSIRSS